MLAHSEKAAAYMADAYARVTGRVGVWHGAIGRRRQPCRGPGRMPGCIGRRSLRSRVASRPSPGTANAYQEVEHAPPLRTRNQDAWPTVDVIDELPRYLEQAFREATDGTPRPVHLDLNGLGGQEIENATLPGADLPNAAYGSHPVRRLRPDPAEIEAAAARLAKARKPVLVAGAGAVQAAAHASVQSLAETLSIPIATSLGGRGIVPTTHALHVGVVGTYSAPVTNQLVHEARSRHLRGLPRG